MARTLNIEKAKAYIWRLSCFRAHSHFAWVEGWNVVDAATGEVVYGGFRSGSNVESGCAYVERKKDAVAFVAGYQAAIDNPFLVGGNRCGRFVHWEGNPYNGAGKGDERQRRAFDSGAITAASEAVRAARKVAA